MDDKEPTKKEVDMYEKLIEEVCDKSTFIKLYMSRDTAIKIFEIHVKDGLYYLNLLTHPSHEEGFYFDEACVTEKEIREYADKIDWIEHMEKVTGIKGEGNEF